MKQYLKNYNLAHSVTLIGLLAIVVAVVSGVSLMQKLTTVSVTGSASEVVESDSAIWDIRLSSVGASREESFNNSNRDVKRVVKFLNDNGLTAEVSSDVSYSTNSLFERDEKGFLTDRILGYYTEATIRISTENVYLVQEVSSKFNQLVIEGIQFNSYSPKYYYSGLSELRLELLEDAMRNARKRGELIVKGDNMKLGKARSVRQGVFQVNAYGDKSVSDYGNLDTSSISKEVSAVVSVDFSAK